MPELRTDLTADRLIDALHPYGAWSAAHTTAAATQIVELVRYLNAATLDDPDTALPDPDTAGSMLYALHTTCSWLQPLLAQVTDRLQAFANDPNLDTSSSTDTAKDLAVHAALSLATTAQALNQLTKQLKSVSHTVERLYLNVDDAEANE